MTNTGLLHEAQDAVKQDELASLYVQYAHLVLRRSRSILRDEAEAQDAMQEVFLRAMKYQHSLERADSKLGWLYRTTERCCFDRLRRQDREVSISNEEAAQVATDGLPQGAGEAREVIMAFLERFDRKVQQVAVLHYLDELPQEEIARQLGWSRRTVGKKLALLRKRAEALAASMAAGRGGA